VKKETNPKSRRKAVDTPSGCAKNIIFSKPGWKVREKRN